jgi:glucose-1-phosphatase
MPINTTGIKNIILDLGGVVVGLDPGKTVREFLSLGFHGIENTDFVMAKYPFFMEYETGKINTADFIASIQKATDRDISSDKIAAAWNTMILDLKKDVMHLLKKLRLGYRIFLLSNTNELHIHSFNEALNIKYGLMDLSEIFEKLYYSHVLGMRKPDREIFEFVLNDSQISPAETLYIDDTLAHIESAATLGVRVYHLQVPEKLTDILKI